MCPRQSRQQQHFVSVQLRAYKLNYQSQVFCFLYAIWPKSKDLYPTYLKATQPPKNLKRPQVSIKFARLARMTCRSTNLSNTIYIVLYYLAYSNISQDERHFLDFFKTNYHVTK